MARKEKKGRDGGGDIGDFDLSSMYGPFHVEWKEDWTDYEAIMKERPDLYTYDRLTIKSQPQKRQFRNIFLEKFWRHTEDGRIV